MGTRKTHPTHSGCITWTSANGVYLASFSVCLSFLPSFSSLSFYSPIFLLFPPPSSLLSSILLPPPSSLLFSILLPPPSFPPSSSLLPPHLLPFPGPVSCRVLVGCGSVHSLGSPSPAMHTSSYLTQSTRSTTCLVVTLATNSSETNKKCDWTTSGGSRYV